MAIRKGRKADEELMKEFWKILKKTKKEIKKEKKE